MIEVTENTVIVTLSNVGPQGPSGIGVQYEQGTVEPDPTGNVILWSDEGDVLKAISADDPLPVNVVSGNISVTMGEVTVNNAGGASAVNIQDGGNSITVDGTVTVQDGGGSITVDNAGTFAVQAAQSGTWNINNISGTISLPTGAATSAKQPAFGTAGTASPDVLTVQGISSMTPLLVDGSGVTQPVSGTVTIQDGGNSITVDNNGTFAVQATQSGTWTLGENSGIDIGDVTINNGAGASAVNIQDGGNSITVDDGGNSITVDNNGTFAVQAAQSGTWNINNVSGTVSLPENAATETTLSDVKTATESIKTAVEGVLDVNLTSGGVSASILDLASNNPLAVAIVDSTGEQITSFGGGTQYVDGSTAATPTGTVAMWQDSNDDSILAVSDTNPLPVNVIAGDIDVTVGDVTVSNGPGSSAVNIQDGGNSITVDDGGSSLTVDGTVTIQDGGNSITVDNGGTFAVQAEQSGTWNINNISGTISLPTGAATEAKQPAFGTAGSASSDVLTVQGIASMTPLLVDGSGVTQPVSGTVTIQDGGNSITVDGTVAATQSGTWNINNISGTISLPTGAATEAKQPAFGTAGSASSDVLTVQGIASMTPLLVDGSGVTQPVSGTVTIQDGGNSITVDNAGTFAVQATQSGTWTLGANSGVDIGDVTINNGAGASAVNIQDGGNSITVDNNGTFAVQAEQSGTWNINNISGTISLPTGAATEAKQPAFGTAGSASSDVLTVQGIASMTPLLVDGSGVTQPVSGTVTIQDGGNSITVDNSGTFAVQASQSGTWTLGANSGVDIGDVTINNGAGASAVNIQDGGNSITVDGTVSITPNSSVNLNQIAGTPTATGNGTASDGCQRVTIASDNTPFSVNAIGNVAHDAADSGNPVKVGGRARTSDISSVANNDRVDFIADKTGKQVQLPYALPENHLFGTALSNITTTDSTLIIPAQGPGLKIYVTDILVTNSASTKGTVVQILSGTGGSTLLLARAYAAPAGGGFAKTFAIPLVGGANAAIYAKCETDGGAVQVTISGYKGA